MIKYIIYMTKNKFFDIIYYLKNKNKMYKKI